MCGRGRCPCVGRWPCRSHLPPWPAYCTFSYWRAPRVRRARLSCGVSRERSSDCKQIFQLWSPQLVPLINHKASTGLQRRSSQCPSGGADGNFRAQHDAFDYYTCIPDCRSVFKVRLRTLKTPAGAGRLLGGGEPPRGGRGSRTPTSVRITFQRLAASISTMKHASCTAPHQAACCPGARRHGTLAIGAHAAAGNGACKCQRRPAAARGPPAGGRRWLT